MGNKKTDTSKLTRVVSSVFFVICGLAATFALLISFGVLSGPEDHGTFVEFAKLLYIPFALKVANSVLSRLSGKAPRIDASSESTRKKDRGELSPTTSIPQASQFEERRRERRLPGRCRLSLESARITGGKLVMESIDLGETINISGTGCCLETKTKLSFGQGFRLSAHSGWAPLSYAEVRWILPAGDCFRAGLSLPS